MTLNEAISRTETAWTARQQAAGITSGDRDAAAAIAAKLEAANAQTAGDAQAEALTVAELDTTLDDLIATAQASKSTPVALPIAA